MPSIAVGLRMRKSLQMGHLRDKAPRQISGIAVMEKHAALWPHGETQVLQALVKTFRKFYFYSYQLCLFGIPYLFSP